MGGGSLGHQKKILSHLKRIAGRDSLSEGRPLIEDAAFRAKLARAELELESVEATMLRALGGVSAERRLGVEANMIKIRGRSEEHTSELKSLMRISYADFCLKKKNTKNT